MRLEGLWLTLLLALAPAWAATPPDVLVMAHAIDDLVSLDPAEVFELTGIEYLGNTYDRLVEYDPADVTRLQGTAAASWSVAADGKTYTFKLREGIRFASGNLLTAEDAAFSLRRVVLLNKAPAFILKQFGFTSANVGERIRVVDPLTLVIETDRSYAPTFLLYCLTATVGSIVDRLEVLRHQRNDDLGHGWLRRDHAGSGPFKLGLWRPNEVLLLERHAGYRGGAPALGRVIIRHIIEPASQRLLLQTGDIDIARKLGADQLAGLRKKPAIRIRRGAKGVVCYLALNQKNPPLADPRVRQALKYLVDYRGLAENLLGAKALPHQAFIPRGFLGALTETPFTLDVAKARALLAEAGLTDGFAITLTTRNSPDDMAIAQSIQATFAQAGVRLAIVPADNKQVLTQYRARQHDLFLGRWGADYQDPHANASSFASNPDNADGAALKTLAWRNAWDIPELTRLTAAAVLETDSTERARLYQELQREHQRTSPFIILFQDVEVIAERANVHGFVLGPSYDSNRYAAVRKD